MKRLTIVIFVLIIASCSSRFRNEFEELLNEPNNAYFSKYKLFDDEDYLLTLTTIDTTDSYDVDKKTVVLRLIRNLSGKVDTVLADSLFSRNHPAAEKETKIKFCDFNFDGINDILIPAGTDPRSNSGYYLYIVSNKNIEYVQGFNEIGNPEPDSINHLIGSLVLAGPPFYKFYEIGSKLELKDLGHTIGFVDFTNEDVDSLVKVEVELIMKEKQRTTNSIR
ncbi:XAC2610-related protein [Pontibacter mangrovi]|uniref:Uncharacterized protein n=1 Tax=Pontibacter mangrovi TaxID=2589816 RepID=A0A501W025_9BACT|nr:hypothetical protein [Pontibacter mangrovi]TPE43019.1 hypothetical protein FJM65_15340 [Pontibacter mangrovi]